MLVRVLESLDETQNLVHRATNRQVVDGDLPQIALVVYDEQTPAAKYSMNTMLEFRADISVSQVIIANLSRH